MLDGSVPPGLLTAERYGERFARIVQHWTREADYITPRLPDAAASAAFNKVGLTVADVF